MKTIPVTAAAPEELSLTQCDAAIDAVREAYASRIVRLLDQVRDILSTAGLDVAGPGEAFDFSDSTYRWALSMRRRGYPDDDDEGLVDCVVQIVESRAVDGLLDDGINFDFSMSEWGGRVLFTWAPYNFTPQVWVSARDRAAVEKRFCLVERKDYAEVLPECL